MPGDPTSLANLAFGVREQTEGTPEREAKLAELAERIRKGEYVVDAETLAGSLLRELGESATPPQSPDSESES